MAEEPSVAFSFATSWFSNLKTLTRSNLPSTERVTPWMGARTNIDGTVFRLFDGDWYPDVERSDSWPGVAWSSPGQGAARLVRFATPLRVTVRRHRDGL